MEGSVDTSTLPKNYLMDKEHLLLWTEQSTSPSDLAGLVYIIESRATFTEDAKFIDIVREKLPNVILVLVRVNSRWTWQWERVASDVGGQRCPDSVRIYCAVSVSQNLKFSVGRVFECPDFLFELDFDRQISHSNSGQNLDSAVRRRLLHVL